MSGPFGSSQWMYNPSTELYGFEISNSLRFNDGSSDDLNFTPSSAGNRKTMTWSGWVKRSVLSGHQRFFGSGLDNYLSFTATGGIEINLRNGGSASNTFIVTNSLHRDVSAWYHIVMAIDTTQGTDTNRVKVYVNGVQQTSFVEDAYPSQNNDLNSFNNTVAQYIGRYNPGSYYDGYMADVNFIDGLALTPASFGELKNDIWIPKDTSGLTFGTNGYRLQFKQTGTSQNSSGIGADTSGSDNHFAVANLTAVDVVSDSPTNNFCLPNTLNKSDDIVFSEGNTKAVFSTFSQSPNGTIGARSGKWYYEVKMDSTHARMGFCESHCPQGDADTSTTFPLYAVYSNGSNGLTVFNSVTAKSSTANSGYTSFSGGDTLGLALDIDNGKFYAHLNGTYYNSGDPANGTGALVTGITAQKGGIFVPYLNCGTDSSKTFEFNFGAPSHAISSGNADGNGHGNFEYAVPTGFLSLCTANLPDPVETIDPNKGGSPQDYFNTVLYTGTGDTSSQTGVGFQPDWVWIKQRSSPNRRHHLQDSVRGAGKILSSDATTAEESSSSYLTSFDSDGFSLGNSSETGGNNLTYASWNWKAGGSGSSNTNGTINTTATSVAAHGGFSISTYTGTGSNATVGHGLSSAPKLVIVKRRNATENWVVGEGTFTGRLLLDETEAFADTDAQWRDTVPSSTVVTIGTHNSVNGSSDTYVMYCFANVDGMQKIGQYTGNGNANGAFAYTGFRPAWVIIKSLTSETGWRIYDSKRLGFNVTNNALYANDAGAADAANDHIDLISNGFKMRRNNVSNTNGVNYLYMAFAEQPFKYANAR